MLAGYVYPSQEPNKVNLGLIGSFNGHSYSLEGPESEKNVLAAHKFDYEEAGEIAQWVEAERDFQDKQGRSCELDSGLVVLVGSFFIREATAQN